MSRITALNPDAVAGETKQLFETIKSKMGKVPNILRTMGHSPAALKVFLHGTGALAEAKLDPKIQEHVALAVAEANHCHYCVAAHTVMAKRRGLTDEQCLKARAGGGSDAKTAVAVKFALRVQETKGFVSDAEVAELRQVGLSDGEIAELVACVCVNIYTNFFNHVAGTEVDFPEPPKLT